MEQLISLLLFAVFTILGLIHFYWASGGKWALDKAIPTSVENSKILNVADGNALKGMIGATIVVGLGLLAMGVFYLLQSNLFPEFLPAWLQHFAAWFIPIIFILRGIGDFNYVGLFKKIKNTTFAQADTQLFIPLCFGIGVLGLLAVLI